MNYGIREDFAVGAPKSMKKKVLQDFIVKALILPICRSLLYYS